MVIEISSQEIVIIHTCMLGLGLLIAVYTLVYPKIEEVMEKNARNVVRLEKKFEIDRQLFASNRLNKEQSIKLLNQINAIKTKIDEERVPPYELFWGFILVIAMFSIPLIKISFDMLGIVILSFLDEGLFYFLFGGVLLLVLLFIMIFTRLHSIAMNNFDRQVKKIREETDERIKKIREIKEKVLSIAKKKKRKST